MAEYETLARAQMWPPVMETPESSFLVQPVCATDAEPIIVGSYRRKLISKMLLDAEKSGEAKALRQAIALIAEREPAHRTGSPSATALASVRRALERQLAKVIPDAD